MSGAYSRRDLLRVSVGGAVLLMQACAPPAPPAAQNAPAGTPRAAAPAAERIKLPTYVAFQGPKPDFPGTPEGVPPAYTMYPKDLIKTVGQPPGKGGDVSIMTYSG